MNKNGKWGVIYKDPRMQLERFPTFPLAQTRYNELAKTAVSDLKFIIILDEANGGE